MKRKLFFQIFGILLLSVKVSAINYYVSPNGNDSNNGKTLTAAFKTISKATGLAIAGDIINVADGTYILPNSAMIQFANSGTIDNWIVLKSINKWGAKIIGSNNYNCIWIDDTKPHSFIEINGFDVTTSGGYSSGIGGTRAHHLKIVNNRVHDCPGVGIGINWGEYYLIEGNICFNNASSSFFSGISVYESENRGGTDTSWDNGSGFRLIIKNNICYNNMTTATSGAIYTDGNGIIVDDFMHTQQKDGVRPNYTFPTLIENNLCYYNGAKGIEIYCSSNVTVRNNTCYWNNRDLKVANNAWWGRGELSVHSDKGLLTSQIYPTDISVYNNILVANPAYNSSSSGNCFAFASASAVNLIFKNNLTFNGTVGNQSTMYFNLINNKFEWKTIPITDNNKLGVNPFFVNPGILLTSDFKLQSQSSAINGGTNVLVVPVVDLAYAKRDVKIDIGAYEFQAPLSLSIMSSGSYIGVYPNPVSTGILNVDFGPITKNGNMTLVDVNGRIIYRWKLNGVNHFSADLSNQKPGLYILQIEDNTGINTVRFILK